jgi:hypothetical protein
MFLDTENWNTTSRADPEGQRTRVNETDLTTHILWAQEFQASLNPGSIYFMETGFNGNGNMDTVSNINTNAAQTCANTEPPLDVDDPIGPNVNIEFVKPVGTGANKIPQGTVYNVTLPCVLMDPLGQYFQNPANLNGFAWTSHTFTHEDLENSTYYDTNIQMGFNIDHAAVTGINKATRWSSKSFIPPGISGMHNGDALKAFMDNGVLGSVGDSTRPVLVNQENNAWPVITTVANNGHDGFVIVPRWATRVYYNVYVPLFAHHLTILAETKTKTLMSGVSSHPLNAPLAPVT